MRLTPLPAALPFSLSLLLLLASPSWAQDERDDAAPASIDGLRRDAVVRAVERVGPAVANIATEREGKGRSRVRSLGSGLVVHSLGFLLTNAHVVERAQQVLVTLPGGRRLSAQTLSAMPELDLALLRVEVDKPLRAAALALDEEVHVGETCIALGNPFGLESSVTRGVISARSRRLRVRGRVLPGTFLQTDAAINPGNSGGPLVNLNGEVIGLNTAIHKGGQGIGFAIPVSRLRRTLRELSDPLTHRDAWLGLSLEDGPRGATVASVVSGGPAAQAGIRAGDVILAAGPSPVDSVFAFQATMLATRLPHLRLALEGRDGERRGALLRPASPPWQALLRERLGLVGQDLTPSRAWALEQRPGGVLVREVLAGPAAELGIQPGDRLFQVQLPEQRAREVPDQRTLARQLAELPAGSEVVLTIRRGERDYRGALTLR